MAGCGASSRLEVAVEQLNHKTREGLTFGQSRELGPLVEGIGNLNGKTLHGKQTKVRGSRASPTFTIPKM
jgi:hypothetical protein